MMMYDDYLFYPFLAPKTPYLTPEVTQKPPTLYAILQSIVNGDKDNEDDYIKISDLATYGRDTIFNFNYPLTNNVSRETFETNILNHYLMRRINFDTVTAFRIALCSKLNEIMPLYNKMFDAMDNWQIFRDGETITRTGTDERTTENTNTLENTSTTEVTATSDRRNSINPQNQLQDVKDGSYVSNYNYDTNINNGTDTSTSNGTSNGTDNKEYTETITKTPSDKLKIIKEMQENIDSIYTLLYKKLDVLFYGIE